jgi:hypothetical protein
MMISSLESSQGSLCLCKGFIQIEMVGMLLGRMLPGCRSFILPLLALAVALVKEHSKLGEAMKSLWLHHEYALHGSLSWGKGDWGVLFGGIGLLVIEVS